MDNKENIKGLRATKDGSFEPVKQKAVIQSRMFQFLKSKHGGRRK